MGVPNIIAGFDLDCNTLFVNFEKLSTVRYSAFVKAWKEINFSLIFTGRRVKELICFTSEALSYIKFFFIQTNSFLRRICALYIMYGIYYKQPIKYTSKVLLTLDEWLQIKNFLTELKENNHFDALYILLTLIYDNAFEFSATQSVRFTAVPDKGIIHTNYSDLCDIESFDINSLTKKLDKIENDYKNLKLKLAEKHNSTYLNYSKDNISKELKEIFAQNSVPSPNKNSEPGTSKNDESIQGKKRRSIRDNAFKKKTKVSIYNSILDTNEDDD